MAKQSRILVVMVVMLLVSMGVAVGEREYNGSYEGEYLNRVAFPLGGMGAGMVCLEGTGCLSHVSVRHKMDVFNEPCTFAALCVKSESGAVAKVLEGPVPGWKVFGSPGRGNGASGRSYGLPRFEAASFLARFPFGTVTLTDDEIPLEVALTGWSPFVPGDADASSLPVGALEYRFKNPTGRAVEAVFSLNTKNFMETGKGNTILPVKNGFILWQGGESQEGGFAFYTDDNRTVVDHCWFKGGWWDSLTLAWQTIASGEMMDNPPVTGECPGASLFVPMSLRPGEAKTVRLMMAWYVPQTTMRYGKDGEAAGPAFGYGPSKGTAASQQDVTGFVGKGLVNSYDPGGDGLTGTLTSPEFTIDGDYIQFLVGGGDMAGKTCVNLVVGGKVVKSATGKNAERLDWVTWEVKPWRGQRGQIKIVDEATGAWGHINVDQIVISEQKLESAAQARSGRAGVRVLQDFEGGDFGDWVAQGPPAPEACCPDGECEVSTYYEPWYTGKFETIQQVAGFWRDHYEDLRARTMAFSQAFYDTTLPPEVVEAAAANLTILKSPTVMRQKNGRLWCWEGCGDSSGCCAGSCTHVWNYAQAICHLFPELERSLRNTEFFESQSAEGHQTFRSALPIRPVAHTFHAAADGQLGGIMKVYREWRIGGDDAWLKKMWPKVKQSLDYCIETWDPRGVGALEEPHHNTYDIEYWGPDGHCTSFYLGALKAAVAMGAYLGDDVARYRNLLTRGREFMETRLYNGEYFYQIIQTEGLNATFSALNASGNGSGYQAIVKQLNQQGPKYQYGTGCLSDGVLGLWMAQVCGLGEIVDPAKVKSNLNAIHQYNLKLDLYDHVNPQRPSYALGHEGGLLLCTWPRGGALSIPFVYSNEVWTGIEYQVASHLMLEGMAEKGLEIVRVCRDRYDGRVRNPFNEYECGHWYARAMSSYGLIQGLTGVRYDAVDKTLTIDSKVGETFRSFLATAGGFGTVGLRNGKPFVEMKSGTLDVKRVMVSGKEMRLTR